jgi:hypothetical protein
MTLAYSSETLNQASNLRKQGYSYEEISKKLSIAKSSAHLWCKNIILNKSAKKRIAGRLAIGMAKAKEVLRNKRNKLIQGTIENVDLYLKYQSDNSYKILCSFLYWGEGEKSTNKIIFANSDPKMIVTFITLLRSSFELDEKKFRALVHVHEYHNEKEIKEYWSRLTSIPLSQFSKSYLKPHTSKIIRAGYKGTISIRYYDYKIALELGFIYNRFAENLIKGA